MFCVTVNQAQKDMNTERQTGCSLIRFQTAIHLWSYMDRKNNKQTLIGLTNTAS